jgi:multidrug transporter EmrE-like cation transporter
MKTYLYLLIAIVAEIIATTSLKTSEQFTKLWPSVLVVCGYITAFYFLSLTLKKMEIGITYALWSGVGYCIGYYNRCFTLQTKTRSACIDWYGFYYNRSSYH